MFLKNAEQTGLQLYRHFSDLIQKNSPILGRFEQAGFSALGCAGKCTGFIPKQFTLQQRCRKCRQLTAKKGPFLRGECRWMMWAKSSLPVPLSPSSSAAPSDFAIWSAVRLQIAKSSADPDESCKYDIRRVALFHNDLVMSDESGSALHQNYLLSVGHTDLFHASAGMTVLNHDRQFYYLFQLLARSPVHPAKAATASRYTAKVPLGSYGE